MQSAFRAKRVMNKSKSTVYRIFALQTPLISGVWQKFMAR
jgi:hypothetical protein